ncbi:MAG: DUF4422 domain-containing protein [Prevotella sp.]|jgi:hypothetical protein|nr:DUF4422 domain-containing protein [Prevotella sp.]MCH4183711.1 DUF4422 domain-containing protein [Prevotella sp.]
MGKTKILVCCHKPDQFISDDVYMPIQVGKAISKYNLGIQGDDTGENISAENPHFCELTGLYWAWKNMKPVDYIGLCHYRRYFNFHHRGSAFSNLSIVKSENLCKLNLQIPDMDQLFESYDVILTKPKVYPYSLFIDYTSSHVRQDLVTIFSIVNELYPDYIKAMFNVFYENNRLSHYNMMIMKWKDFDDYCNWLFSILFEAKKRINISYYSSFQGRIWGYLSERLLSVYVLQHRMKIKYYPVYWINDNVKQLGCFTRFQRTLRAQLAFELLKSHRESEIQIPSV